MGNSALGRTSYFLALTGVVFLVVYIVASFYVSSIADAGAVTWAVYIFFAVQVVALLTGLAGWSSGAGKKGFVIAAVAAGALAAYLSFGTETISDQPTGWRGGDGSATV